jgi:hypothetical protein
MKVRAVRREKRTKPQPYIDWHIICPDSGCPDWKRMYNLRPSRSRFIYSNDDSTVRQGVQVHLSRFTYTGCSHRGIRFVKRNKHTEGLGW